MSNKQNPILPKLEELSDHHPVVDQTDSAAKPNRTTAKRKPDAANKTTSKTAPKRRKKTASTSNIDNDNDKDNDNDNDNESSNTENKETNSTNSHSHSSAGHRPVTSCTHCRQHKIKCNASEKFPDPCSRCQRMNLKCEIDPQFRPKKGSQIQSLRNDVDELRSKIEYLTRNETLIAKVLQNTNTNGNGNTDILTDINSKASSAIHRLQSIDENTMPTRTETKITSPGSVAKTHLQKESVLLSLDGRSSSTPLINDSATNKADLNPALEAAVRNVAESPAYFTSPDNTDQNRTHNNTSGKKLTTHVNTKPISGDNISPNTQITEFILGDVKINIKKAQTLHKRFVDNFLPYLPIMVSNDPIELYQQSQLLFWTVMLTACLSDPDPSLYISFASLIKQLAIETCWIRTPRSTHIVQSLLILSTWPLPNQKVLDDCSYRFIGLAKSLSLQLGLHRGKFMAEFSRTQVALPDAEKWRSRTWLAVFFCEQFWSSNLGLPPSLQTDYLLESARIDKSLPKNFRCLISLAIFQAKLVNIMGLNVSGPDGLMDPANRAGPLHIMERELERLVFKLEIDDLIVEIYYLYVKLMVCLFSFLPETPSEDQTKYVTIAYHSATRIVTIMSKLLETKQLTEYPIYVRHSVTTAAFILFRLHLTPYLLPKYIDSSRQSIVTVHRLFRNMLAAWKDVENDISRTATVLEKLNFVIITHPELFIDTEGIIVRMRSHLTGSLFYDLVWNIHEARRRTLEEAKNNGLNKNQNSNENSTGNENASKNKGKFGNRNRPLPLPFYNQITKDDFTTISTTTPNGTTVTTLVPTDQAIINAKASAFKAGLSKPTEINGIPLAMLEATGSLSGKSSTNLNYPLKTQSNTSQTNSNKKPTAQARRKKANVKKKEEADEITSLRPQRSTSMNAAVNGFIPPPLFPSNITKSIPLTSKTRSASSSDVLIDDNTNFSDKSRNSGLFTPTLDNQNSGLTPVSISGLDRFFESTTIPISNEEIIGPQPQHTAHAIPPALPSQKDGHTVSSLNYANKNNNYNATQKGKATTSRSTAIPGSTNQSPTDQDLLNEMFIDSIFQQTLSKPTEDDDLLGWFDMNMAPEF